jgi:hypothetical protein
LKLYAVSIKSVLSWLILKKESMLSVNLLLLKPRPLIKIVLK